MTQRPPDTSLLSAACADADPELFYPPTYAGPWSGRIRAAKIICSTCAMRLACLRQALRDSENTGIWGGLTPEERRKVRRDRPDV
ncbi:WhiB family transcriptional regulator [Streptomyces lunalinharesii]